jgi:GntR family transcriptional regulator
MDNKQQLPKSANPLYQVVSDVIEQQILNGEMASSERLPSEAKLCAHYNVGRNTIRHALQELVKKGVLTTVHGVGTFVADQFHTKTAEFLYGFTQEVELEGFSVSSKVMEAKIIIADEIFADKIEIEIGDEIVYLHRLRLMDGEPTAIEKAYLPHKLFPNLLSHNFETNSLYQILSGEYKQKPDHAEQEFEAALASESMGELLKLDSPGVVIIFHRSTRSKAGTLIEYVDSSLRSDKFRFYTKLKLHGSSSQFSLQHLSSQSNSGGKE